jgi:hypothetical protein
MSGSYEGGALPPDADWVELSDSVLAAEGARWLELAEHFAPLDFAAGRETGEWLRDGVRAGEMLAETHAVISGDGLLGFFSVQLASADLKGSLPIFEMSLPRRGDRKDQPIDSVQRGLLISSIARSRQTDHGFGSALIDHAIGLALSKGLDLLFVRPVNSRVARMWEADHCFRPVQRPAPDMPGVLWFPVRDLPGGAWPS